jgi:hypothetical protein
MSGFEAKRFARACAAVSGAVLLIALLPGCASVSVVELQPPPPVVSLHPAPERIADRAIRADLAFFDRLDQQASALPKASPTRIEALTWLEAARREYLSGSWHPWLDEAAVNAHSLVNAAPSAPASEAELAAAELRVVDEWIGHVRSTRGFRASLSLLARAEVLRATATDAALPATVRDAWPREWPDRLFTLQHRLAELHDRAGIAIRCYAWAKAQAWLDFALDEHFSRDRSGVVAQAAGQAEKLIDLLERSQRESLGRELAAAMAETPALGAAGRVKDFRRDLWATAAEARPHDLENQLFALSPSLATLAQLEVALIRAAHEHGQRGRRASRPYQQGAERLAYSLASDTP